MRKTSLLILLLILLTSAAFAAGEAPASFQGASRALSGVDRVALQGLDNELLLAVYAPEDGRRQGPLRFAEPVETFLTPTNSGSWETLADGRRVWRLRLQSPGATNLSLMLRRFELPEGAELWLYDPARELVQGPYARGDQGPEGELWTALVLGDEVVVELDLLPGSADAELAIGRVHHGFRAFGPTRDDGLIEKQGGCQNDVVCPEANPWRRQVRAVAWYSVQGTGTCSGTLMNNTAKDGKPYFLSAEHCEVTRGNASSMVVYWNYESPTCGRLAGGSLKDNQSGATFRASYRPSDFVLVELKAKPKASSKVFYAGWNAVNRAPQRAVGIHHPNLDEKAISFNNRPLRADGPTHWEIVWSDGTTEPGSSGSCIFDKDGLCVGTLTGGDSFCWDPQAPDYYGRMSVHFTGGGGQASSLRPWLDPTGSGRMSLAGLEPAAAGGGGGGTGGGGGGTGGGGGGTGGGSCQANGTTACLVGGRFEVTVDVARPGGGNARGTVVHRGDDSGLFSFSGGDTWDLVVNLEDKCGQNGHWAVTTAAASNLAFTLRVEDTRNGRVKTYRNAAGQTAKAVLNSRAFTCP